MKNKLKNDKQIKLVEFVDTQIVGRALADVRLSLNPLVVPVSGQSSVTVDGSKCEHGNYIPATSNFGPGIAPYCSECRPYEIVVKKNATFEA